MDIEFDSAKDEANTAKHSVSLSRAVDMEILTVKLDERFTDEERYRAWGLIDGKHYCLAFTPRPPKVRVISLRRADKKEIKKYVG